MSCVSTDGLPLYIMNILFRHNWQHSVGVLISIWYWWGFGHLDYCGIAIPENMSVFGAEEILLCHRFALVCISPIRSFLSRVLHQHNFNSRHLDPKAHRTLASTFPPSSKHSARSCTHPCARICTPQSSPLLLHADCTVTFSSPNLTFTPPHLKTCPA